MYTCEEQDIVSLVDSICEVLMDEDLQVFMTISGVALRRRFNSKHFQN